MLSIVIGWLAIVVIWAVYIVLILAVLQGGSRGRAEHESRMDRYFGDADTYGYVTER